MASGGWFFLVLLVLIIIAAAGWLFLTRRRAQRQGLPPPPLSSYNPFANRNRSSQNYTRQSGVVGWAKSKLQSLRGSGSGAYERTAGAGQRRGLDPDGAWDARVGDEADLQGGGGYYEEQELGLRPPPSGGPYTGGGYDAPHRHEPSEDEPARGRRRSRDDAFVGGSQGGGMGSTYEEGFSRQNPFGDTAERSSMRGVSPRPTELDSAAHGSKGGSGGQGDSPTERRSMFHENM